MEPEEKKRKTKKRKNSNIILQVANKSTADHHLLIQPHIVKLKKSNIEQEFHYFDHTKKYDQDYEEDYDLFLF